MLRASPRPGSLNALEEVAFHKVTKGFFDEGSGSCKHDESNWF